MKTLRLAAIISILLSSINISFANEGLSYDESIDAMSILKTRDIEGVPHVAFYIKSKDKGDLSKANFRMTSEDGGFLLLKVVTLSSIPVEELDHEDIARIKEGFEIKLWVPKDRHKYRGWVFKHDLRKGSLKLVFSRIFTKQSIQEKRDEMKKDAEQGGDNDAE